jgi:hypothetical protein
MTSANQKTSTNPRKLRNGLLPKNHPTSAAFVDESGSVAFDRFFAVGCLKMAEPSVLLRQVQKLRDQQHFYSEIHFKALTAGALPFYRAVVDLVAASDAEFSCFVADRDHHDPVTEYGSSWRAYEKLAVQLLCASIKWKELVAVHADKYSTPDNVVLEKDIRSGVNNRLGRLAVVSVCQLDSESTDALQIVDLFTSAVAHEFRQSAGLAGSSNPKARLAAYVRAAYNTSSCLKGSKENRFNVEVFWSKPRAGRSRGPKAAKSK